MRTAVLAGLALAGLAGAQAPAPAVGPITFESVMALAEAASAQAPPEVAAGSLAEIAKLRMSHDPKSPPETAMLALRRAVDLARDPLVAGSGPALLRRRVAADTAASALRSLQRHGEKFDEVHELVKLYDLPRAPLFAGLMWMRMPDGSLPPNFNSVALALESLHGDGSFPYTAAMPDGTGAADDPVPLLRLAYAAAADEADWSAFPAAIAVLQAGHARYPNLDEPLETAARSMLKKLEEGPPTHPPSPVTEAAVYRCYAAGRLVQTRDAAAGDFAGLYRAQAGPALVDLLASMDPTQAVRLHAQNPAFANPSPCTAPGPSSPPPMAGELGAGLATARSADPDVAARGTGQVLGYLAENRDQVAPHLAALIVLESHLGAKLATRAAAESLGDLMLDASAREIAAVQRKFETADPDGQAGIEQGWAFGGAIPNSVMPFLVVAQFDSPKALARARALQAPLALPVVLTAIAMAQLPMAPME